MAAHPPKPGRFTQPNFLGIEQALSHVTFPITKKDLLLEVDGKTALIAGQNHDLRDLVKDLHDDAFDNEEELHIALERYFKDAFNADLGDEDAPAQSRAAWNDPDHGNQRGAADWPSYQDVNPGDSPR